MKNNLVVSAGIALTVTCLTLGIAYLIHTLRFSGTGNLPIHTGPDTLIMENGIRIEGEMENPGTYDRQRLIQLGLHNIRVKEYDSNDYRGIFEYTGVPLRKLLEDTKTAKQTDNGMARDVDLVVTVYAADGTKAVLSYGEIFCSRFDNRILLATHSSQVIPGHHPNGTSSVCADCHRDERREWHDCTQCHNGKYKIRLRPRERLSLICGNDRTAWRNLEDVRRIVVSLPAIQFEEFKPNKINPAPSRQLQLESRGETQILQETEISANLRLTREEIITGMGMGYQNRSIFTGIPIEELAVSWAHPDSPATSLVFAEATDHYRAVFSWSELYNAAAGCNIEIVTRENGKPLDDRNGLFKLVVYTDLFADRSIRCLSRLILTS